MPKKSKVIKSEPIICDPAPYTAEEQETRFKKDYEFNKPVSARSPVGGWENKYIREDKAGYVPPKEKKLVLGGAHSFKGMRLGNRYSSRPAGHRIGARKSK